MLQIESLSPLPSGGIVLRTRDRVVVAQRRLTGEIAFAVGEAPSMEGVRGLPFVRGLVTWMQTCSAEWDWAAAILEEDLAERDRLAQQVEVEDPESVEPSSSSISSRRLPKPALYRSAEPNLDDQRDVLMKSDPRTLRSAVGHVIFYTLAPQLIADGIAHLVGRFGSGFVVPLLSVGFQELTVVTAIVGWSLYLILVARFADMHHVFQMNVVLKKLLWATSSPSSSSASIESLRPYPNWHPRIGAWQIFLTTIFLGLFGSMIVASTNLNNFVGGGWFVEHAVLFVVRAALFFVCLGVVGELQRALTSLGDGPVVRIVLAPLIFFDRLTSREPTEAQLDLGVAALRELKRIESAK